MPPRDVWNCNAIFQPSFYFSYSEFIYRHRDLFGWFPSDLIQDSEWSDDSDDESDDESEDSDASVSLGDTSMDSRSTELESLSDDDSEDMSIDSDDRNAFSEIVHLLVGRGDEDDPFDLTFE